MGVDGNLYSRGTSIKTRIETFYRIPSKPVQTIREAHPLKQGLKQIIDCCVRLCRHVFERHIH
ncbi:hypothetical protein [Candidatus Methanoperedens sp. BLZ2]|uniref:hypothetical protein n=1 Tax=Candidatus Methanoperedens sp. BLZ2 TaxID=2035255 RepID=UPI0038D25137